MTQLLNEFWYNLTEGAVAFGVYLMAFLFLFYVTEKGSKDKYANFKRAHPDDGFFNKDFKVEFSYFLFNKLITNLVLGIIFAVTLVTFMDHFLPYHIFANTIHQWPLILQVMVGLLLADAAFFFPHWFSHKFLWRFHSIHHSAETLSWVTAARLHPVDQIPFIVGGALAMHVLGFEGQAIVYAFMIHNGYNMFVHANMTLDFPKPFCYILTSPNYHHWHHAADKVAYDKNFATMFPIFDLMFGTYYYPQGRLPEKYGLSEQEHAAFPKTFGKQLLYPFKKKY